MSQGLTLPCSECEHDVEIQEGVEQAVCLHCHATLTVVFDAEFIDDRWRDRSYTYMATPVETR